MEHWITSGRAGDLNKDFIQSTGLTEILSMTGSALRELWLVSVMTSVVVFDEAVNVKETGGL